MPQAALKNESSAIAVPGESQETGALQRGLLLLDLMVNAGDYADVPGLSLLAW